MQRARHAVALILPVFCVPSEDVTRLTSIYRAITQVIHLNRSMRASRVVLSSDVNLKGETGNCSCFGRVRKINRVVREITRTMDGLTLRFDESDTVTLEGQDVQRCIDFGFSNSPKPRSS